MTSWGAGFVTGFVAAVLSFVMLALAVAGYFDDDDE